MKVRFLKSAYREVDDAVAWYGSQSVGLDMQFLDNLDEAVRRIVAYPCSYMEVEKGLRRCLISRFPYGIFYGIDTDTIIVVAVAHLHREPRYWIDRMQEKSD
ncbi:MAG: plasmid stabilization protein [Deltaproteobacteria bacterium RIFCSPLOWO2_02_FULL_53_8]|nr:MAG: plasmid stabilization protein [Deltaproteobacteria bacterium RIFCSPLOWO2_02_FULL_53_8]